jgi:hypothetical protein
MTHNSGETCEHLTVIWPSDSFCSVHIVNWWHFLYMGRGGRERERGETCTNFAENNQCHGTTSSQLDDQAPNICAFLQQKRLRCPCSCHKNTQEKWFIAPLILPSALDGGEWSASWISHFTPRNNPLVSIEQEGGWATKPFLLLVKWQTFDPGGIWTPDHPACSLITTLTMLSWLLSPCYNLSKFV